jgi:hypothetical protein
MVRLERRFKRMRSSGCTPRGSSATGRLWPLMREYLRGLTAPVE